VYLIMIQKFARIKFKYAGEVFILNDIDASLAAFHPCNKGLVFAQGFSQVGLAHACGMTLGFHNIPTYDDREKVIRFCEKTLKTGSDPS